MNRLRESKDALVKEEGREIMSILRVMTVLKEYICEFDSNYSCERIYSPLYRYFKNYLKRKKLEKYD